MDLEKLSEGVKTLIRTAEDVFVKVTGEGSSQTADAESSQSKKSQGILQDLDLSQLVAIVEGVVSGYIREKQDFRKQVQVKIKFLPNFKGDLPKYESLGASGLDVRAQLEAPLIIKPLERVLVPTGLSMEVPLEYEIQARPRSGLALKKGLSLPNTPGTIDADYRGEIKVIMINLGQEDVVIEDQERIAQLVVCPVVKAQFEIVEDLSDTTRGAGGFGSTGVK